MTETTLITGGLGCIGAEAVKWLIANTTDQIVVLTRNLTQQRIRKALGEMHSARVVFETVDIRNQSRLENILTDHRVSSVVHMAALQTPDCNANRDLGLQINLAGTQNLIEAIKSSSAPVQRLVYASSVAVYGPRAHYPGERVSEDVEPLPVNPYGVWKLAGEHLCRQFVDETGVSTAAVRPAVLFGPGRDAGLTSSPTTAMKQVAIGKSYEIPFSSKQDYQFAPDVGAAVGMLCRANERGYTCYTFPSATLTSEEFAQEIRSAATELGLPCNVTVGRETVPFICDVDSQRFAAQYPEWSATPVRDAIKQSIQIFAGQATSSLAEAAS